MISFSGKAENRQIIKILKWEKDLPVFTENSFEDFSVENLCKQKYKFILYKTNFLYLKIKINLL